MYKSLFATTIVLTLLNLILTGHPCDKLLVNIRINANFKFNKSKHTDISKEIQFLYYLYSTIYIKNFTQCLCFHVNEKEFIQVILITEA